ncbi:DUF3768 domain-containing protein [Methylocystis hirsuta]|uniref:DUF3768 domain-containing protein n=2 Tax=Methylocystis hirsuta TaxID=369798 RepID=A0A3M9XKA7_9HYPH|nr:DUF3768 domain-containing protein [Methylocystis hirsuta]
MSTIAELNDAFRRQGASGVIRFTNGLAALPTAAQEQIMSRVREFDAFTEGNDPYGEHDRIGDRYNDLGARIVAPESDLNLGIVILLNGATTTAFSIDATTPGEHTLLYTVTRLPPTSPAASCVPT